MRTWRYWQAYCTKRYDVLIVLGITLLVFALSGFFNMYEWFTTKTRYLERWQIDEMPVAFLAFSLCCVWLLQRRARELAAEMTRRQHMTTVLQESEARYRAVVEGSLQGMYIHQSDFIVRFANQALVRIFGYDSAEALLGQERWLAPVSRMARGHEQQRGGLLENSVRRCRSDQHAARPAHQRPGVKAAAHQALRHAMQQLDKQGIDYTQPWGQLQVAVRGKQRLPIHGGGGEEIYNAIDSAPIGDGQFDAYYGSSAVWTVSFEGDIPRAQGFLTYSQSTDPTSPYYADQTRRFSDKAWITFPFSEQEIAADRKLKITSISE